MLQASMMADVDFKVAPLDRRIFGTFVEHIGRCVYGGIYEPGHPTADERGFRGDVLELARELGATIVRYPGGNFVSGYNWEDGVGPKARRPRKLDLAWGSTETNQFGTNEFIEWCREVGMEPMFAVNLGTRGPDEARNFLEYCNHPGGAYWSDLRRAHGYEAPHDVRFWCMGNEMDGPWQLGQKTADEYGRVARETAKLFRMFAGVEAPLTLTVCGSADRRMKTFAKWEHAVLQHAFHFVDMISLHQYFDNLTDDLPTYFTALEDLDYFIKEVVAIADAVAAERGATKKIMVSLDEWNVWYRARSGAHLRQPGFPVAPTLLEEIYNFEDALVVGGALIVMINNADRLKTACLAQLVNVLGPIFTETGGPAWRQTIFHPFALASRLGHGTVLQTQVKSDTFSAGKHRAAPFLIATVVHNPETGEAVVFALNRSQDQAMELQVDLRGTGALAVRSASELHHEDLKAINSRDAPDEVILKALDGVSVEGGAVRAALKPHSWNAIHLGRA